MVNNESLARYKLYLCRKFLEKIMRDGLISEQQKIKAESAVLKNIKV